jgi:exopolysaccharide biosynthesis protein
MLIDDYDPVGESFAGFQSDVSRLEYEDLRRHQGVRHPRTAVALTGDNHFLMVVVDGRRPGVSEGMSARELTRFLKKNFNPRYALNMDGGGSSTLVVAGEGDPKTHVVNRPTDAKGERTVASHFVLVHE